MKKSVEHVLHYHEQTKHHFHRFANSTGSMDWSNQPNPFRFYSGCNTINLPFLKNDPINPHSGLYLREVKDIRAFTLEHISGMIELSLGLSAWKQVSNSKWSLRMNPSSGNLHPTESYWILPQGESHRSGTYHYNPLFHVLELRAELPETINEMWKTHFGSEGFFCALSSIFWRESWKYGERAFRYCNHDVGHALAALSFAANLMGWKVNYLTGVSDQSLQQILGFDQVEWIQGEAEEVDLLCWVCPNSELPNLNAFSSQLIDGFRRYDFHGEPEALSREKHPWPIIETASEACQKQDSFTRSIRFPDFLPLELPKSTLSASQIIRQRRSAVDFDQTRSAIRSEHFFGCLQACLPRKDCAPFDVGLIEPALHLFIFVHNVPGLEPGLYALVRNPNHFEHLKAHTHPQFHWEGVQEGLPLYILEAGNLRGEAKTVSCHQDIAGDSAFSMGMVARFRELVEEKPYHYKHLFWEAGMIGQVLYLQAEAYGHRGTGIGCFFDDPMHKLCGFTDNTYQSLYHFTIGTPIQDERVSTLPPYHHLKHSKKSG